MPCRFVSGAESAMTALSVEAAIVSLFHARNRTFQAAQISERGGTMVTYQRGATSAHNMQYRVSGRAWQPVEEVVDLCGSAGDHIRG